MRNRDDPAGPGLRCSVGFRSCHRVMVTPLPWPRSAVDQLQSGTTRPLNGRIQNITDIPILRGWLSEGRADLTISARSSAETTSLVEVAHRALLGKYWCVDSFARYRRIGRIPNVRIPSPGLCVSAQVQGW